MLAKIVIYSNGDVCYYNDKGEVHRVDGPAIEKGNSKRKVWCLNGRTHRIGGPAIEYADGDKEWFINGKLHRLDGPAAEYVDGSKQWALHGYRCSSKAEWECLIRVISC